MDLAFSSGNVQIRGKQALPSARMSVKGGTALQASSAAGVAR
jgi:hypothetical protein